MTSEAMIAINRFGLGARGDEPLPADPRHWLRAQWAAFDPRPPVIAAAPGSAEMAAQLRNYVTQLRATQVGDNGEAAKVSGDAAAKLVQNGLRTLYRDSYGSQARARIAAALVTPAPFAERLVHFWANHFAISADKLVSVGMAGTLEFEAIRPNLFGSFGALLRAVESHPAMLLYLDQAQSIGPGSAVGRAAASRPAARRRVGLNENLAREILELHTLGVGGGYDQADVGELARALTGWSIGGYVRRPIGIEAPDGVFVFQPGWHEPGARILLGRRFDQPGVGQGTAMLDDLATRPATARHLAIKLARHFAGDTPPPALVDRLVKAHLASGGDLPTLYGVLIDAPEIWAARLPKFRNPWDWTIAALRAVGVRDAPDLKIVGALNELGQPVWRPGSPAGWDDTTAAWAAPDALLRRVELAGRLGALAGDRIDARRLGPLVLGSDYAGATADSVARAETAMQGMALMLVSPEFLRR